MSLNHAEAWTRHRGRPRLVDKHTAYNIHPEWIDY